MSMMPRFDQVPAPNHPPSEFLSHDAEAREVIKPMIDNMLDSLARAGWDPRTAASAMMFHAAARVSSFSTGEASRQPAG